MTNNESTNAQWRRSRPLVGGVLVVLAGIEMFFSGQLDLGNIQVKLGIEGFQATIIPALLALLGVLIIFMPQHRIFYGILALAISVYAIVGVNLGGFIVGTLLGCVGGIMAVAWMPPGEDRRTRKRGRGRASESDTEPAAETVVEPVANLEADDKRDSRGNPRSMRRIAAALASIAFVMVGTLVPAGAASAAEQPTRFCIPIPFLVTCDTPAPTPSSTPTPAPSQGSGGVTIPGTGVTIPGTGTTPGAGTVPGAGATPGATDSTTPVAEPGDKAWDAAVDDNTMIVTSPGAPTTGSSLSLTGIPSIALVNLRLIDGSKKTVLKLTADSITMDGFALDVQPKNEGGRGLLTVDERIELTGGATIYLDNISLVAGGKALSLGVDTPAPPDGFPTSSIQLRMGLVGVVAGNVHHVNTHQAIHN